MFSIIPKKNSRNIKNRRELVVLLQSETPELEAGDWVRGFEPTFSRFLEVTGDVIVGNCLKLITLLNSRPIYEIFGDNRWNNQ